MTNPSIIQADIIRGQSLYNELISKEIYLNQLGISSNCECNEDTIYLLFLLKAIQWRLDQDKYDNITQDLYEELLEIIGDESNKFILKGYYGYKETGDILTAEQIEAGIPFSYRTEANVSVPFTMQNYSRVWFAIASTEPIKTSYIEMSNPTNTGDIGSPTDFMNAPTLVSGVRSYNFYISNYQTSTNTLTFIGAPIVKVNIDFGYSATDPYGIESVPDLQFHKRITSGSIEYGLKFTNNANLNYIIIKEPIIEPIKTIWVNYEPWNKGEIPDTKMRAGAIIGDYRYYVSRVPFALSEESSIVTLKTL